MTQTQDTAPFHVAIIPDGNRRWARSQGLHPWEGHSAGAANTEKLIKKAYSLGVTHLSFWGSSIDNLTKRPMEEKVALLDIYRDYFKRLCDNRDIHEKKTKIRVIGRWREQFPAPLRAILERCIEMTRDYDQYSLNFFLAYGGDDEMLEAIRRMIADGISSDRVAEETLRKYLMTSDVPVVDYLVRTGGEPHLSAGFMMWHVANSQLYFSDKNYPDFGPDEFSEAIEEFHRRARRFGR